MFAAGGPAPITVTPFTEKKDKEALSPALKVASASACMVVAWAALKQPVPHLDEAESIAANARRHNGERCDACQTHMISHENNMLLFCIRVTYWFITAFLTRTIPTRRQQRHCSSPFLLPLPAYADQCVVYSVWCITWYTVMCGTCLLSNNGIVEVWAAVARTPRARFSCRIHFSACSWG